LGVRAYKVGFSVSTYLNTLVDSHHRATVLSFKGLAFNFAYGGISLLFALALRFVPGATAQDQLANAFALVPCWLVLVWILLLVGFRKHRNLITRGRTS
jgi:hypothetical protein